MRFLLFVLLALGTALPAAAQLADSLCTYDACALRYEPQFFGVDLVRGTEGIPVDSGLSSAVSGSPQALEYARTYERTRTPALLALFAGTALLAVATPPPGDELIPLSDGVRFGLALGGVGLGAFGLHLTYRSSRAQSRAVWFYNQSLVR
jgi:hypothetical protein